MSIFCLMVQVLENIIQCLRKEIIFQHLKMKNEDPTGSPQKKKIPLCSVITKLIMNT